MTEGADLGDRLMVRGMGWLASVLCAALLAAVLIAGVGVPSSGGPPGWIPGPQGAAGSVPPLPGAVAPAAARPGFEFRALALLGSAVSRSLGTGGPLRRGDGPIRDPELRRGIGPGAAPGEGPQGPAPDVGASSGHTDNGKHLGQRKNGPSIDAGPNHGQAAPHGKQPKPQKKVGHSKKPKH